MQTFSAASPPFTSATYSTLVSPLALRSGLANTLSLDFGPSPASGTEDGGGLNDDNYTDGKPIQTFLFAGLTVEFAFNMNAIGGFQALVGKDGKPLEGSPVPPFKAMVRGDAFPDDVPNQLFVEWIDGDGDIHFLATRETVTAGAWNHVAFTLTADAAQLWVAGEQGDYVLKDTLTGQDFASEFGDVIFYDPTPWTVGRGMFDNGVTDWSNALIDEVRVSDAALVPDQFLFEPAPAADNADFNDDGAVDGADLLIWQRTLNTFGALALGDANLDGNVDGLDLAIWEQQFGGVAGTFGVPEPASITWVAWVTTTVVLGRARRRSRVDEVRCLA
jgi:hypothetical protein